MKMTDQEAREKNKKMCSCGMPQSYPIPHDHDLTERERLIIQSIRADERSRLASMAPEEAVKLIEQALLDMEDLEDNCPKGNDMCLMDNAPETDDTCNLCDKCWSEYLLSLISPIYQAKLEQERERVIALWDEVICPMCYRLNPQHASMDHGKGCHWCQDREDWLKSGKMPEEKL